MSPRQVGTLLRREERNISSNLSRIVLMDKLQVISQIIFDGELMIFMTMTLGLRRGYLLKKVNLELTKRAFFYKGATLFNDCMLFWSLGGYFFSLIIIM